MTTFEYLSSSMQVFCLQENFTFIFLINVEIQGSVLKKTWFSVTKKGGVKMPCIITQNSLYSCVPTLDTEKSVEKTKEHILFLFTWKLNQ